MSLCLVNAPSTEPVSLEEVRLHCQVDVSDEDTLLSALIIAARQHAETVTGRAFLTQTWDLKLDTFPCGAIVLPFPPVTAVTSITYLNGVGTSTTWDAENYRTGFPVGPQAMRGWIEPAYGVPYPSTYGVRDAVTVRFECGYGEATDVPEGIKAAIKILVKHWYEHRVPVQIGNIVTPMPQSVDAFLWSFKVAF